MSSAWGFYSTASDSLVSREQLRESNKYVMCNNRDRLIAHGQT
jgi:hypothetical protein